MLKLNIVRGSAWNTTDEPSIHDESLWKEIPTRRVLKGTGRGFQSYCSGAQGGACRY